MNERHLIWLICFFFSSFISLTFKGMSRPAATKPVLQKKCTQCTSIYFSCIYFFVSRLLILFKCPLLSPDGTSMADKNDLLSEVKVLKKAGRHPNIVSLVGVCTREGMFYPNPVSYTHLTLPTIYSV